LYNVVANTNGVLGRLDVGEGMIVNQGDVLGMISMPLYEEELRQARERLEMIRDEMEELATLSGRLRRERFAFWDQVATDNTSSMAMMESVLDKLEAINARLAGLQDRGMVPTELESIEMLQEIMRTSMDLTQKRQDSLDLEIQRTDHDLGLLRENWERQQRLLDAEHDLLTKLDRFTTLSLIASPIKGMVVALQKSVGDAVASGDVVAVLQPPADPELYVAAFVPAAQARSIRPGQTVHLSPGHIASQRWGYVLGEVRDVGQYPTTLEQITSVLKNPDLARMIQGNAVMTRIKVKLVSAPENPGGVRWTGRPPANASLSSGTLCTASFITEQRAPISYVMPWVREKFLGQASVPLVWVASPVQ
jgi:HlyD family secretion protein